MLREADSVGVDEDVVTAFAPALAIPTWHGPTTQPATRYGEGKRFNWAGAILTVLVHLALVSAFLMIKQHIVTMRQERLTVVNLTPAPPPPSPSTPETPAPQQAVVVSPRPAIAIPRPSHVEMVTTPDPVPQPVPPSPAVATPAPPAPPAPPAVVQASDLGTRMVAGKAPSYPTESRRKHEQGTVVLTLTLGFDGRVTDIGVSRTSGFDRLDQAALSAVRKWRWEPLLRGGQPVMVRGVVEIPFVLQG
ncbi:hypothetical protein BH10PSE13_BH10PSE13_04170 [soil metagenome]